jgi:hypothetical protein
MRQYQRWLFGLLLLLLAGGGYMLASTLPVLGPRISASSALMHEEIRDYHPLGITQRIKYSYPNRPFDTDLTIEGIGWKDGGAFLVLKAQVNAQAHIYSHMSAEFSPHVTYQGKTVTFSKRLWQEGACNPFDSSICRYAVTADESGFLPPGTMPDSIHVSHAAYPLPPELPPAAMLPAVHLLEAQTGSSNKIIESGELTYAVKAFRADEKRREVVLLVTSDVGSDETSRFLLRDDQGRIYTFTANSLPKTYGAGENEIVLQVEEPLPADITHLNLVIFESRAQQLAQYFIESQATIPIF